MYMRLNPNLLKRKAAVDTAVFGQSLSTSQPGWLVPVGWCERHGLSPTKVEWQRKAPDL